MDKIDDGFYSWLVKAASFDGILQIPIVETPKRLIIPKNEIPFSKIAYSSNHEEVVHFYEHDCVFKDILRNPEKYTQKFYRFLGIITPDCSLYRDMPLSLQIVNTYMNRAVGCFFQEQGVYVITNIRWGDERSYKDCIGGNVPLAFMGAPIHSIVSISTYGCIRGKENTKFFREGLEAMMWYLKPKVVLVHGSMPRDVFRNVLPLAEFHQYYDWTTQKRKKVG